MCYRCVLSCLNIFILKLVARGILEDLKLLTQLASYGTGFKKNPCFLCSQLQRNFVHLIEYYTQANTYNVYPVATSIQHLFTLCPLLLK